jgi:phosphoglycolate/pyridoxal phosphate phosphatase family enzyme
MHASTSAASTSAPTFSPRGNKKSAAATATTSFRNQRISGGDGGFYSRRKLSSSSKSSSSSSLSSFRRRLNVVIKALNDDDDDDDDDDNSRTTATTSKSLAREIAEDVDTILLDCDGVIWHGDVLVPGAKKAIEYLRETLQKRVFFVTNNATKTREYYSWKFSELGIEVDANHIYTAAFASASYLSAVGFNNSMTESGGDGSKSSKSKKIYVVGEQGLVRELEECDVGDIVGGVYEAVSCTPSVWEEMHEWTGGDSENDHDDDSRVDAVVVGQDTSFTFAKLAYASYLIQKGAKFIATNPDAGDRLGKEKLLMPGAGPIVKAIETASGKAPDVICGKPGKYMFDAIMSHSHGDPQRTMVIGDRIDTDVKFGKDNGAKYSVLVLTGANKMKDVEENEDESKQPSFVVGSLAEACGIPFDPNEPTARVGERANMAKNYPVSDGEVHDLWASGDIDDDDEYDIDVMEDDDDFIPAT